MFTGKIYETWMGGNQEEKIKEILKNVQPQKRILDIGCGPGFLEQFIKETFLVDIDLENLKKAGCDGNKVLADGSHLPFKDRSFKTIFCIDTIHLLNTEKITGEIKRALADGMAIITTFCNEYNKSEKMSELKTPFEDFTIEREFFAGTSEIDAVIVVRNT